MLVGCSEQPTHKKKRAEALLIRHADVGVEYIVNPLDFVNEVFVTDDVVHGGSGVDFECLIPSVVFDFIAIDEIDGGAEVVEVDLGVVIDSNDSHNDPFLPLTLGARL